MAVRTPVLPPDRDGAVCYLNALIALRISAHAQIGRFPWEKTVYNTRRIHAVLRSEHAQALDIVPCVRGVIRSGHKMVAPFPRGFWSSLAAPTACCVACVIAIRLQAVETGNAYASLTLESLLATRGCSPSGD